MWQVMVFLHCLYCNKKHVKVVEGYLSSKNGRFEIVRQHGQP